MSFTTYIKENTSVATADFEKAQQFLDKFGGRLEQVLISMGLLSEEDAVSAVSGYWGISADVPELSITEDELHELKLDIRYFIDNKWLPLKVDGSKVSFVAVDPFAATINQLLEYKGLDFEVFICSESHFRELERAAMDISWSPTDLDLADDLAEEKLMELASETPVVNLVNNLISAGISRRASDMHLEPHNGLCRVRLRIDGVLQDLEYLPLKLQLPVVSRLKILSSMDIAEKRRPQDGKISMKISGIDLDIRVSAVPLAEGESLVMRFLIKESLSYDLEKIGIAKDTLSLIRSDLKRTNGVILLTGPTGSGKTTTLYSFLNYLNDDKVKLITLEDPVEYQLKGVNQIQVKSEIGYTFAQGLRSVVRQDPDIIMVGEIRDRETAEIAMQSALTGHLVFSTLHTNDAPSSYTRLMDLGVEEFLLNSALIAVVAQRLVRKLCDSCKKVDDRSEELTHKYKLIDFANQIDMPLSPVMCSPGCKECSFTGYKGRMALIEYLRNDLEIHEMPKNEYFVGKARKYMHENQQRSLFEDGLYKVLQGNTTIEEVLRVTG
ncbi:MAG: GspE/PulE family protein [Lentisphaeraceae bacterium]|nr:GspE/PulE family protein [Lentisphaeraceae bacterium]